MYWRKKQRADGSYPAGCAEPGTSNHGKAIAIDAARGSHPSNAYALNADRGMFLRFVLDAPSFGFSWESQDELWHIRYVLGDQVAQRVLDIEAFVASIGNPALPAPVPAPAPVPTPVVIPVQVPSSNSTENIVNALPVVQQGSVGFGAKLVQSTLLANGHVIVVDGQFGPNTKGQVQWFQGTRGLKQDGIVGPVTWAKLLGV